jgi:hypothetical protein
MTKFLLIIGVGRSGTTLLQSMLNAHPEIVCPPESHFIEKYVIPEVQGHAPRFARFEELTDILTKDAHLQRLKIDAHEAIHPFAVEEKPFSFRELFLHYLHLYAQNVGKSIVGEKGTVITASIRDLCKAFPNAYVVHIMRDPRDVILSTTKTAWGRGQHFVVHVRKYAEAYAAAYKNGPTLYGDRYIEIRYEDLIDDPQAQLFALCQKLGVDFYDEMLNFHEKSHEIVSPDEMAWKRNVFKPVLRNNMQKWRYDLRRWQILAIEGFCAQALSHSHYPQSQLGGKVAQQISALPVYGYAAASSLKRATFRMIGKFGSR